MSALLAHGGHVPLWLIVPIVLAGAFIAWAAWKGDKKDGPAEPEGPPHPSSSNEAER